MSTSVSYFSIEQWLNGLGLGEYTDNFIRNDVNELSTLTSLNEQDLERLGIDSLGHRKKILAGIASLGPSPMPTVVQQQPEKSGTSVWTIVGVLLAILLLIFIISALGL